MLTQFSVLCEIVNDYGILLMNFENMVTALPLQDLEHHKQRHCIGASPFEVFPI